MADRTAQIGAFLTKAELDTWHLEPIAGDASGRRYARLHGPQGQALVLMDADPAIGEKTEPFVRIAQHLHHIGLSAPHILQHDVTQGLMIIEDLGADDFSKWLKKNPDDAPLLYQSAVDVLIHLHRQIPPPDLPIMTPQIGGQMTDVVCAFYAQDLTHQAKLAQVMTSHLAKFAPNADVMALRDYHAENLIWRPMHQGPDRVGLLDFQDAFCAPAGYDLASLLRDARRDVAPDLVEQMVGYFVEKTKQDDAQFRAAFACLGVQRNLRILGVFARLALVAGKTRYLALLPRVWDNLMTDLAHPELIQLRDTVLAILPPPQSANLKALL